MTRGRSTRMLLTLAVLAGALGVTAGTPAAPANAAPLPTGCASGPAPNIAVLSGVSYSGTVCGNGRFLVITRLLGDGRIDTAFADQGRLIVDSGAAGFTPQFVVTTDGKPLTLEAGPAQGGVRPYKVRRFLTTGQPDGAYGSGGVATYTPPTAITANRLEVDSSGRAVITFPFTGASPAVRFVRFTSGGVLDAAFGGDGVVDRDGLESGYAGSRVLADGRIVWSDKKVVANAHAVGVERLLASDGEPDTDYGEDSAGFTYFPINTSITGAFESLVSVADDGGVTIQLRFAATKQTFGLIRFLANGDRDPDFMLTPGGGTPLGLIAGREGPFVLPNGDILTWSVSGSVVQLVRQRAVLQSTPSDRTFLNVDLGAELSSGAATVLGVDGSGRVLLQVAKSQADGTSIVAVARVVIAAGGTMSLDPAYGTNGIARVQMPDMPGAPGGTVFPDGTVRLHTDPVIQFAPTGTPDTSWALMGRATLRPELGPTAPESVSAAVRNATQWTVRSLPPPVAPGAPIVDFVIQTSFNGGSSWTTNQDGVSSTTVSYIDLTPAGEFLVRVAAVNVWGIGSFSTPIVRYPSIVANDKSTVETQPSTLEYTVEDSLGGSVTILGTVGTANETGTTTISADLTSGGTFFPLGTASATQQLQTTVWSDPFPIDQVQADAQGHFQADVVLPDLEPGQYLLAVVGDTSGVGAKTVMVVADDGEVEAQAPTFNALTPTRLIDTRPTEPQGAIAVTQQRYGGTNVLTVKVTGAAGVPELGVAAVSLNVTAVLPLADGFVTVYPCGDLPLAANVNYVAGDIIPNAVFAPVSPDGEVCFYSPADTHLVVDINGWFAAGRGFNSLTPTRLFDTRPTDPQGAITVTKQRYGGLTVLDVTVAGVAGVPETGVGAVSLNVAAVTPLGPGYVTVFPCGDLPLAANLNYETGQIVANAVVAPVSADGRVCFYSQADVHLVADVNGWFGAGQGFQDLAPDRLFDTRPTEPQGAVTVVQQRYGGTNVLKVKVTGALGVPLDDVAAVSLNVTAVEPVADGFVTVFPCGALPLTASLNYVAGQIVPNAVIAPLSATGEICLFSSADTHLVADVNGYFPG